MDVSAAITSLLADHPAATDVLLVGSRARGTSTPLSDWDFRVECDDVARLVDDLPMLVQPLRPLAAQWDRLAERAVFMLILEGAIKVDLFPGDLVHEIEGPWVPDRTNLHDIDAHFWDWTLWLAGKHLAGRDELVLSELTKLFDNLLGPLGATEPPGEIRAALDDYLRLREDRAGAFDVQVDGRLGTEVLRRLEEHNAI